MTSPALGVKTDSSQGSLKGKTSRVSLSTRSPTRPPSPSKKESTPSPRLHVRPKKVPLTARDITVSVKRIIGSSAKSHRELNGSTTAANGSAIVYPAGATVVQCSFSQQQGHAPTYRYYCAPPDQEGMNDLITAVSSLNLSTSTPPSSRSRYQTRTPRARASMGFDVHRGTPSPSHQSSPGSASRSRSKHAKDRIRVLGCVAISPDQSWITGGEKGYAPRVLIYPNSMNAGARTSQKMQAILEHSDGIRCMAFSPCNNFLVSVGTVHDQCIIVYKFTSSKGWIKVAAAKFKDIIDAVVWSRRRIITVGRRHLRVWEWHENSSSGDVYVLSNRNVLYSQLGDDAEFFAAAATEGDSVVVASRTGFVYLLDAGTREIKSITDIGREITCIAWDKPNNLLWIGGENGSLGAIPSNFEENVQYRGARTELFSEIVAISAGTDLSVIDATGEIHSLSNLELQTDEIEHSPTLRQVNGAIKGLRLIRGHNVLAAKFFTWTGHRVCFLDEQQCLKTIDLDDSGNECPEIECAAFCPERGLLIIGDNYRTLRYSSARDETDRRVIDIENDAEIWAEEIDSDYDYESDEGYDGALLDLDVQTIDGKTHIISAWRDHTVLVYSGHDTWRLTNSLNHHRLGVNYARFYDKRKFITSSLDRTIVISQLEESDNTNAVQTLRTINLARAHAVDMEFASETTLVVSTSDRQILLYDISSGDLLHAYKTADSSELITLGNIGLSKPLTFPPLMKVKAIGSPVPQGQIRLRSLIAGAGNDKSIRIYDHETGTLLSTKWSHAESITGLLWLPMSREDSRTRQHFVTVGTDGCIVIWELAIPSRQVPAPPRFSPRTISQRFRRSMDDILKHE